MRENPNEEKNDPADLHRINSRQELKGSESEFKKE
jgi:hypothetical protein